MNSLHGSFTKINKECFFVISGLSNTPLLHAQKIVKKTNFFARIINSLTIFFKTKITKNWSIVKVIEANNDKSKVLLKVNDIKNILGTNLKNFTKLPQEALINNAANQLYLNTLWNDQEENLLAKAINASGLSKSDQIKFLTKLRLLHANIEDIQFLADHLCLNINKSSDEIQKNLILLIQFLRLKKENQILFPGKKIEFIESDFTSLNEAVLTIKIDDQVLILKTYKELFTKASVDATYLNADPANGCDYAFSDLGTNLIAVFDGAGHNNQLVHNDQVPHFKSFCIKLKNDLKNKSFISVDEAKLFLSENFNRLANLFKKLESINMNKAENNDSTAYRFAGPALMCGFITSINDQKVFIGAQVSDCCLYHKSENGSSFIYPDVDNGLGQQSLKGKGMHLPTYFDFVVDETSEIYAFSDGIGEFVTKEEFIEIMDQTQDSSILLQSLKEAITGPLKEKGSSNRVCLAQPKPVKQQKLCKIVSDAPGSASNDDISLAYLKVSI